MTRRILTSTALATLLVALSLPASAHPPHDHRSYDHRGLSHSIAAARLASQSRHRQYDTRYDTRYDNRYDDRYDDRSRRSSAVQRARAYAAQATAQAHSARRLGCRVSGPRWTRDWNDHFHWALDRQPKRLQREIDRRDRHLYECQARHHYWP